MSAEIAVSSAFSGSRRHLMIPTRRGVATNENGVSQTPANSETTTLVCVSSATTVGGSPPVN